MKKRARLFFTIASLCMTISMFVFGVYSASQLTYSINGSVSYEVRDVLVTISTTVAYGPPKTFVQFPVLPVIPYTEDTSQGGEYSSYTQGNIINPGGIDTPTLNIKIDFNKAFAWKITINIKTINENGIYVNFDGEDNFGIPDNATYAIYDVNEPIYNENISPEFLVEDTGTDFVYYIYITDLTKSITSAPFEIPLIITQ